MSSATNAVVVAVGRSGTEVPNGGRMVLQVVGTAFSGTWRIVRKIAGTSTWVGTTNLGSPVVFTGDVVEVISDPDDQAIYDVEMLTGTGRLDARWAWL